MKRLINRGRLPVFVLSILVFATVALFRCMSESVDVRRPAVTVTQTEKHDPCAAPTSASTFVQTSTAMIEGQLTVRCYDKKKQEVKRKVFVDGSDTDHVTFEPIYVSQGPHVVKLEGNGYTPPCRVVTIVNDDMQEVEFSQAGGR